MCWYMAGMEGNSVYRFLTLVRERQVCAMKAAIRLTTNSIMSTCFIMQECSDASSMNITSLHTKFSTMTTKILKWKEQKCKSSTKNFKS